MHAWPTVGVLTEEDRLITETSEKRTDMWHVCALDTLFE